MRFASCLDFGLGLTFFWIGFFVALAKLKMLLGSGEGFSKGLNGFDTGSRQLRILPRLTFTPENLTGYYYLDLGNAADYALAEQILVLNQWEIMSPAISSRLNDFVPLTLRIDEHFGYVDTSQHGNRCHLRNMTYGGPRLPQKDV